MMYVNTALVIMCTAILDFTTYGPLHLRSRTVCVGGNAMYGNGNGVVCARPPPPAAHPRGGCSLILLPPPTVRPGLTRRELPHRASTPKQCRSRRAEGLFLYSTHTCEGVSRRPSPIARASCLAFSAVGNAACHCGGPAQ